jgi:hypothetical protein
MSEGESRHRPQDGAITGVRASTRVCAQCGLELHEVATMRSIRDKPTLTVHRCDICKKVTASEN